MFCLSFLLKSEKCKGSNYDTCWATGCTANHTPCKQLVQAETVVWRCICSLLSLREGVGIRDGLGVFSDVPQVRWLWGHSELTSRCLLDTALLLLRMRGNPLTPRHCDLAPWPATLMQESLQTCEQLGLSLYDKVRSNRVRFQILTVTSMKMSSGMLRRVVW
jgi:hypothetical protein